ncbi:MAG: TolC family protein [Holophaga sp.]|nr:TolC family protein [Holophaga sp.]
MRMPMYLAAGLIPMVGMVQAQVPPTPVPAAAGEDPTLLALIQDAEAKNPDLAQAKLLVDADRERIPQAKALPDPSLSLGIQNDGFHKIQVGQMETSYYQVMLTQPLPWPGKRGLRGEIAQLGAQATDVAVARTRLSVEANIRRSYTGLLLVRGQLRLLEDQALFLQQAEATAKSRYEVGQGVQADLLRAQLERTRLNQTRFQLQSEERIRQGELNRLRGMSPATPIPTPWTLDQVPDPQPASPDFLAQAVAQSPELRSARLGIQQAQRNLDLAKLNRHPDFSVSAGLMPRGGLEPMWTASVGITLPLWQKNKQKRAVAEQEYRQSASGWEVEKVRCLLEQRIQERDSQLTSALQVLHLYREGLLVQSEASFRATLSQYTVGRTPFLSVLEALNGWVADQSGLLQAKAQAQAIQIAQNELNLGSTPGIGAPALSGSAMGSGSAASTASAPASAQAAAGADSGASSSMSSSSM